MNERLTVIGIEHRSYVSKRTGKKVEGYNLYLTQEVDDSNLTGVRCFSEWVSPDIFLDDIKVGSSLIVTYNRYGRVSALVAL